MRRTYDAVEAGVLGKPRQARHLLFRIAADARCMQILVVEARQHRNAEDLHTLDAGLPRLVSGGAHHRRAAGRMNVEDRDAKRHDSAHAASDRVRDVVPLQIGQDRQAESDDCPAPLRSVRVEEFEPDLEAADKRFDGAAPVERLAQIDGVECAKDRIGWGGAHAAALIFSLSAPGNGGAALFMFPGLRLREYRPLTGAWRPETRSWAFSRAPGIWP